MRRAAFLCQPLLSGSVCRTGRSAAAALREPAAHGHVVKAQREIGQHDAAGGGEHQVGKAFSQRSIIVVNPGRVDVDEGVVDQIERIGDVAGQLPAAARCHQQGEGQEDAERLVEPVDPEGLAAQPRHGQ